jgi:hypothetical protein
MIFIGPLDDVLLAKDRNPSAEDEANHRFHIKSGLPEALSTVISQRAL